MSEYCPCGSGRQFKQCCQPYLQFETTAARPETLMRSRYSAYVTRNIEYLLATWHPECHAENWRQSIIDSVDSTQWLGLNIIHITEGTTPDEGYVEFAASYSDPSRPQRRMMMRERSRFLHCRDRWYYVDGVHLQTGRNDACPCGSGKKYKKCCGQ
ncbi:YchJ family protein [Musicola keenii]|uniref:YchJ family protein n=1 Tax=Musicola keenii TaxID=2884250 RepID=UPI00177D2D49